MVFGHNLTKEIKELLNKDNTFAVTDENVVRLYPELFNADKTFVLSPGEDQKNFKSVSDICAFLLSSGADRKSHIVAVGGGVIGDITGFCASIYMRGIAWSLVPTTLLALCDSSIGGKTGVNLKAIKNALGTFHFPIQVYLSAHFVKTLDDREFICGMGEIIKTAALKESIFEFVLKNEKNIFLRDIEVVEKLIKMCAEFKNAIVLKDPHERSGLRKILNYGHTVGHAFETADKHKLSHGEYILHGMRIENRLFGDKINPTFFVQMERLINLALGGKDTKFAVEPTIIAAGKDKKNQDKKISVVAVTNAGEYKEHLFESNEFSWKLREAMHNA